MIVPSKRCVQRANAEGRTGDPLHRTAMLDYAVCGYAATLAEAKLCRLSRQCGATCSGRPEKYRQCGEAGGLGPPSRCPRSREGPGADRVRSSADLARRHRSGGGVARPILADGARRALAGRRRGRRAYWRHDWRGDRADIATLWRSSRVLGISRPRAVAMRTAPHAPLVLCDPASPSACAETGRAYRSI
jgi:hypothetical protein